MIRRFPVRSLLLLALGPVAAAADANADFILRLDREETARLIWGDLRSFSAPRGPLGRDEADGALRRGAAIGAHSNAIFEIGPLLVPSRPLRLNVDVLHGEAALTQGSYVMVEVLDRNGEVRAPFLKESCLIADINDLGHLLTWNTVDTSVLAGETVSLRIHARDARIYSLHTTPSPARETRGATLQVVPQRAVLAAWDTTRLDLRAQTVEGRFLSLDRAEVRFIVDPPDVPLQLKVDKRDRHLAFASVAGSVDATIDVSVRAVVSKAGVEITSSPAPIRLLASGRPAREPMLTERRAVQVFLQAADLGAFSGDVRFEAETLEPYAESRGLPVTPKAMVLYNREVAPGRYQVWGSTRRPGGLFRAETSDGIHYTRIEPLHSTIAPEHLLSLVYNPRKQSYLAFERTFGPSRWRAHVSTDGINFALARSDAVFADHDGAHLMWDDARRRYLVIGLTYQRLAQPRRFIDNLKWEPLLGGAGVRRVFALRTSPDGLHWDPAQNVTQRDPSTWLPDRHLITPDAGDPPDTEFYWFLAFPHHGRWIGMAMRYAPSPFNVLERYPYDPYPSKHGPHLDTEWWLSADGEKWDRPFRNQPAARDWRIYFGHAPMRLHDRLLFLASNQNYNLPPDHGAREGQNLEIYSVPIDRIAGVVLGPEGEVITPEFSMPAHGLALNYRHKGRLQVALEAPDGAPLADYTLGHGSVPPGDAVAQPLVWGGRDGGALAGRKVRLRLVGRDAKIFALYGR